MMPIVVNQRVIAFGGRDLTENARAKYLNSSEHLLYNKSRTFYGLDMARRISKRKRELVISEGYTDLWALHRAGLQNSLATCGTALTADHARILARLVDGVVLCYDGDLPGQKAVHRGLEICLGAGLPVRVAQPPSGSDPDDLDSEVLARLVREAPDAITHYAQAYSGIKVRDQRRLLEDLRRYIYGSPSSVLRSLYLNEVQRLFRIELKPPKKDEPEDKTVDVLQRAVFAIMQDYDNADVIFEELPIEAIRANKALAHLHEACREGHDPATWVSAAPESVKKKLVSSIGLLRFTKNSVKRIRLLILHQYLTNRMICIEDKISSAESLGNDPARFLDEWEEVDQERSKLDADLYVSV